MVVAFDTWVLSPRFRYQGLQAYALRLLEGFQKLHTAGGTVTIRPFVAPGCETEADKILVRNGFLPAPSSLLRMSHFWRCGGSTLASIGARADLLFSPTPNVVPLGVIPVVATVADVTPLKLPPQLMGSNYAMRAFSYIAARLSRKIITLSECSKRDIVELYRVPPEKVSVIYCGYDDKFYNATPPDEEVLLPLLKRFRIRQPYIFHHGTIQPRKNFQRLIEAYGLALENNRNLDVQLVLAGSFGWQHEAIIRAGSQLKGRGQVIFTGSLSETELSTLLKCSIASVVPSLYEGFCLPLVEAMACGVPTIAANSSCLPEISGGVLRYFDPLSVEDMAVRINELLEDRSLRNQLAAAGARRANEFSWVRCAQETYDFLIKTHGERVA